MSRVRIDRRVYLTEDRSRAVPEGDPEARHLLCPAGGELDRAEADRYGLLEKPKPEPDPEPSEEKAEAAPANKARGRATNK